MEEQALCLRWKNKALLTQNWSKQQKKKHSENAVMLFCL